MRYLRPLFVLALLVAFSGTAYSQKINPDDFRNGPKVVQAFRSVVAAPSEATVRVLAGGKEVAFGTIIAPDGWILTKWSEIEANKYSVAVKLKDGTIRMADVRGVKDKDEGKEMGAYDLALLKIEADGLKTVQWRPSKDATVGKWVASPGIGADPIAVGVVSVATRKYKQGDQPPKVNNDNAGYLGVGLEPGEGGAKVTQVSPKSPAEKAGLKSNDIIYEAAGKKIIDHETLINTVGRLKPKDEVLLKVKRGGESLELKAVLGVRPKELRGNPQETMGTRLSNRRGGFPVILQHDSGVRPEDCGGPLVDLDGKAIGINIARAGRTETYAIPSEDLQRLIPELKSGKFAPADDDPNLVLHKIRSLTTKDPFDGKRPKLGPNRHVKVEEVKLAAGITYIIEMSTAEKKLDPYLILEDPKGKIVAEDDDGGAGEFNAKIVFTPPADGVYRIIATTFNPNETGGFALSVRRQVEGKKK